MKPINRFHLLAMFTILSMTIISCKKVVDKLYKDPLATLDACYINKITTPGDWSPDGYLGYRTYVFTYNKKGNPVSVLNVHNDDVGEGNPNHYFKYDKHHRLTDWIGLYGLYEENPTFETWHKYGYDRYNRIVKDTVYVWGSFGPVPDPANCYGIVLSTYTYDSYNRIIRNDVVELQAPEDGSSGFPYTYTYNYNSAGNLNGYIYDNKVNLSRTNKIWMFVNKDYSLNNRIGATGYNNHMLPLGFGDGSPSTLLHISLYSSVIDYICKDDDKK